MQYYRSLLKILAGEANVFSGSRLLLYPNHASVYFNIFLHNDGIGSCRNWAAGHYAYTLAGLNRGVKWMSG